MKLVPFGLATATRSNGEILECDLDYEHGTYVVRTCGTRASSDMCLYGWMHALPRH